MTRQGAIVLMSALTLASAGSDFAQTQAARKPNILVIIEKLEKATAK